MLIAGDAKQRSDKTQHTESTPTCQEQNINFFSTQLFGHFSGGFQWLSLRRHRWLQQLSGCQQRQRQQQPQAHSKMSLNFCS